MGSSGATGPLLPSVCPGSVLAGLQGCLERHRSSGEPAKRKWPIPAETLALPFPGFPAGASTVIEHRPPRPTSSPIALGGSAACDGEAGTPEKQTTHRPSWADSVFAL
jgi:hypothetical protein